MNLRSTKIILSLLILITLGIAVVYKLSGSKNLSPEKTNISDFKGPTSLPHIKGPTGPPPGTQK